MADGCIVPGVWALDSGARSLDSGIWMSGIWCRTLAIYIGIARWAMRRWLKWPIRRSPMNGDLPPALAVDCMLHQDSGPGLGTQVAFFASFSILSSRFSSSTVDARPFCSRFPLAHVGTVQVTSSLCDSAFVSGPSVSNLQSPPGRRHPHPSTIRHAFTSSGLWAKYGQFTLSANSFAIVNKRCEV